MFLFVLIKHFKNALYVCLFLAVFAESPSPLTLCPVTHCFVHQLNLILQAWKLVYFLKMLL